MKKTLLFVIAAVALAGCDDAPEGSILASSEKSDSGTSFKTGGLIPHDPKVYTITGTIQEKPSSLVRQEAAATGSMGMYNGYGSGSFTGDVVTGKGIVRLQVSISDCDIAKVGDTVLLKTSDTKATGLGVGDQVTFKCRKQCELIAPLKESEAVTEAHYTWELDFCRLVGPVVNPL